LPQGQTINQHVYKNILRRLMRSVREKWRELWETRSGLLHHDKALAHIFWEFGSFLPKIILLYWSNHFTLQIWPLVTSFCFPNSRKSSKELVFIKTAVTRELRAIPEESFQECVEAWQRILPGVRGSVAEEIRRVHPSSRRL